jgi:P-type E1-E2 ATPase
MGLQPRTARVVKDGREEDILIAELQVGDKVSVRPGEQIPVDGVIVGGNTFIDESMISGEPIPVEKKQGDKVLAGTINQNGAFTMTAQKVGKNTVLAQIIRKNIRQEQHNALPNGLICLKGGELEQETMPVKHKTMLYDLKNEFTEDFFKTKKVVYVTISGL